MSNKFFKWFENYRKVITYGVFLTFLSLLISPIIKEANYKNKCIKLSEKGALKKFNVDDIEDKLLKETGLNIKELAKIEGYKNCIK